MKVYSSKHYKLLLLVPIIMLFIMFYFSTQVKLGIEFRGGTLITLPITRDIDSSVLESDILTNFNIEDLEVRKTSGAMSGLFIEFTGQKTLLEAQRNLEAGNYDIAIQLSRTFTGELDATGELADQADVYYSKAREIFKTQFVAFISEETGTPKADFSVRDVGPSLGSFFLSQAQTALIFAFVLIAILIFYYFRTPLVSFAAVQSALFDAFLGYSALGMFGIPLSLATIAPLLMLIGYSVDTDIMLTDRVIKRRGGTPISRIHGAIKTGLTMTGSAIGVLLVLFIVSSYANMEVLRNISLILLIGLVGDLVATWFTNAPLLLWHLERKKR